MHRCLTGLILRRRYWILLLRVRTSGGFIDLGTIGQKAGFTETLDTQVKKILNATAAALKKVALDRKPKAEKGRPQIRDEEFLEVHFELTSADLAKPSTPSYCRGG